MLNNNVQLTDDELSILQTSLSLTLDGYSRHIEKYGKESLDLVTLDAIKQMKELFNRFNDDYFISQ